MSDVLVAYFSASGVTQDLSIKLSEAMGADLYEIKPVTLYTDADLDWRNENSRSSVEMKDRSFRPQIMTKIDNMDEYKTIFIGFPIWWYREPSIIDTFLESYDFSGKVIVPFATSGSSGMGDTAKNIQELAKEAIVKEGKVIPANIDVVKLKMWASGSML